MGRHILNKNNGFLVRATACLFVLANTIGTSFAAQGDIHFGGDLTTNNACVVIVRQGGTLIPNVDATQMSSKLPGGNSGIADIYSLWRYNISVSAPSFFDSRPLGGDDGVTFTALYSAQSIYRGRTFAEQSGDIQERLRVGFSVTRVNVNLIADRPDSFPAGNYSAHTVVRCE